MRRNPRPFSRAPSRAVTRGRRPPPDELVERRAQLLRDRGLFMPSEFCHQTLITVHPSSLLRQPDENLRARDYNSFVSDLREVRERSAKVMNSKKSG